MREGLIGRTLVDQQVTTSDAVMESVAKAINTSSGALTATLVPFFAATAAGGSTVVDGLGMDLSRALLAGISYEWRRPFTSAEQVQLRVTVEDIYAKGTNTFAVLAAEFTDTDGALVQRQSITFIERGSAA